MKIYDVVIIGSGQAGNPLATAFADKGKKIALIEKEDVGGSCINHGCTPTKTMISMAKKIHTAKSLKKYGITLDFKESDPMSFVQKQKTDVVESFRKGLLEGLKNNDNIDLYHGEASFVDSTTVAIAASESASAIHIKAEKIFINTGCEPFIPPIEGLNKVPYDTSLTLLDNRKLPDHLMILGGGYIGVEFAQMFKRFGSKVTIIEQGGQLLKKEDSDIANTLKSILEDEGIEVLLNTKVASVRDVPSREIILELKTNNEKSTISGSHLLVATGREPTTDKLKTNSAKIATDDKGFIKVNDLLETNVANIYALGDVKGGPQFTHVSYDDYRVVKANLIDKKPYTTQERMVPNTVFTDPQLGRIGLNEKQAKEENIEYEVVTMPMSSVARGIETDQQKGLIKVLYDKDTKMLLGASVLAPEGGEIMSMLQIAMIGKLMHTELKDAVLAHPTYAELLNNLFAKI